MNRPDDLALLHGSGPGSAGNPGGRPGRPAGEPRGGATPAGPLAAAEIERRVKWPLVAIGVFLAMLAGLLAMAGWALFAPGTVVAGLPADPDVRAACDLVRGLAPPGTGELRFESALLASDPAAHPLVPAERWRVLSADALIARARARRPHDPRLRVCAAHLELAARKYAPAERGYRAVLYFGDHCPEAHLGLGVTLALEAQLERDRRRARSLQLQAAAQFAAVSGRDAPDLAALYDRAVMLERVGRRDEARRWARAYLALDPASGWAEKLKRALALEAMASAAAGAPRDAYRGEPPASGP